MLAVGITADLLLAEAAERYMSLRSVASTPGAVSARYIRHNTEKDYASKLRSVQLFFGSMRASGWAGCWA